MCCLNRKVNRFAKEIRSRKRKAIETSGRKEERRETKNVIRRVYIGKAKGSKWNTSATEECRPQQPKTSVSIGRTRPTVGRPNSGTRKRNRKVYVMGIRLIGTVVTIWIVETKVFRRETEGSRHGD